MPFSYMTQNLPPDNKVYGREVSELHPNAVIAEDVEIIINAVGESLQQLSGKKPC